MAMGSLPQKGYKIKAGSRGPRGRIPRGNPCVSSPGKRGLDLPKGAAEVRECSVQRAD